MFVFSSFEFRENIPTHVRKLLDHTTEYMKLNQREIVLALLKLALEQLENVLESDSYPIGMILLIVAVTNAKIDKYDEAESFFKRAIVVLDKYIGKPNFAAGVLWILAKNFYKTRQFKEIEFFGKIAIESHGKLHKIDALKLANLNDIIGKSCLELKKPEEAKEFLQAALSFYAKKFDISSVEVTQIFKSLEIAYFWRNNIAESKELFENSNEIADVAPLCLLGMLCEDENLPSKAVDYYQRAVKIYESKGYPDDSQLADINLKLGKCYLKIGNCLGSRLYLDKSRAIYEKTLADDDPVMLDVRIHLALCCVESTRLVEARKIYEEILGNVYTDGSGVSILEWAQNNRRNGEDKVPILNGKFNVIVPALMNLSALYILGGKYKVAKILQNFVEAQHDLIEDDGN